MKFLLTLMLVTASFIAFAEASISTEKMITSGDPAQTSLGYQRCFVVTNMVGNAAIKSSPDEGSELIAVSQRFSKLFKNAVDLRTEGKRIEVQATTMDLIKMYGQMATDNAKRSGADVKKSVFVKDLEFCKKRSDEL